MLLTTRLIADRTLLFFFFDREKLDLSRQKNLNPFRWKLKPVKLRQPGDPTYFWQVENYMYATIFLFESDFMQAQSIILRIYVCQNYLELVKLRKRPMPHISLQQEHLKPKNLKPWTKTIFQILFFLQIEFLRNHMLSYFWFSEFYQQSSRISLTCSTSTVSQSSDPSGWTSTV